MIWSARFVVGVTAIVFMIVIGIVAKAIAGMN